MLVAVGMSVLVGSTWPLVVGGIGLLGVFVVIMWGRWTPDGRFGIANGVTALRVGLLAFMPLAATLGPSVLIGLSLGIIVTDGADGWIARYTGRSSTFGAFFDKESDALFLLVLCGLAAFRGRLPLWILGAGLLRYTFVVALFLVPRSDKTEERSNLARYVYGGMITALLFSFLPFPDIYYPVAVGATTLLAVSFGRSLWAVLPHRTTWSV